MSPLSLFNYLNIEPQQRPDMYVTVTVTIIKVIATVNIIWITLMDLIEFNIMRKIKNTGKNVTKKIISTLS